MSMLMGARGVGALLGPLAGGRWAQHRESRLRTGILAAFFVASAGYISLGMCTSFAIALLSVMAAHAGTSTNWVFSSTLLQIHTEDRFRRRVFSADYGLCMLAISASSYLAGIALDFGVTPSRLPSRLAHHARTAVLWALALRWTR
jgi:predicted MFS family arabinose efflux permease